MEYLRCVVERITYRNERNGYSVLKCRAKGFQDLIAVVGAMPDVHVGSVLSLGGAWKLDAKYGRQFSAETVKETLPATVVGIEKYLKNGLVKGIGSKFAQNTVGDDGNLNYKNQSTHCLKSLAESITLSADSHSGHIFAATNS